MIRTLLQRASPEGPRARLSILIFHRVLAQPDPIFPGDPDVARFDEICLWLANWFNVLRMDDAVRRLGRGDLPARSACITFDDGFADNHDLALPILQRHGLTATFFVATSFLSGGRMFNDRVVEAVRRAPGPEVDLGSLGLSGLDRFDLRTPGLRAACIGRLLQAVKYLEPGARLEAVDRIERVCLGGPLGGSPMMTAEQVRRLHQAGMTIGAHTRTHPILARLEEGAIRDEMLGSKADLEGITGMPVSLFAYPNGKPREDYSAVSVRIARELGFEAAVSTAPGAADRTSDRFQLPRLTPWDPSRTRFGLRLWRNLRTPIDLVDA